MARGPAEWLRLLRATATELYDRDIVAAAMLPEYMRLASATRSGGRLARAGIR